MYTTPKYRYVHLFGRQTDVYQRTIISYDNFGYPTTYKNKPMYWDKDGRLSGISVNYMTTYSRYDAQGNRIAKSSYEPRSNLRTSHDYEWSGNKLLREGYLQEQNGTEKNRYSLNFVYNHTGLVGFHYEKKDGESGDCVYIKNAQGDIRYIAKLDGFVVGEYVYDAWGNCKIVKDLQGLATLNPFRYRGYYWDGSYGLYYLMSRFYDPETGRFISPDSIDYLKPSTVNGCNLYAYCLNNPVMLWDGGGTFAISLFLVIAAVLLFTPIGGVVFQVATSAVSYAGMAIASIWDSDIRADMNAIGWNPFNTNESAVLGSSKVSFYKGAPVFRTNGNRSGSFYAIFLTHETNSRPNPEDILRHEWGHNVQAMIMGPGNYGLTVGIMSPPAMRASKWGDYYNSPWEAGADYFGGVKSRTHTSAEISRAKWYLAVGTLFFPAAYFFLI